ncbi:hypothetical protein LCGC14_2570790 [marine sediment metagenome]|uniref:Uncharacterized protein n=1 Tax=marine sediment metagenome TaxID=412755 RepID=A0A0F9CTF6_9ZZZZ
MSKTRSRLGYVPNPCSDDCEILKAKDAEIADLKADKEKAEARVKELEAKNLSLTTALQYAND